MKTRDEQAEEYLKSNYGTLYKSENKSFARIVAYRAFRNGWDAALKSQWRDAREVLPEDGEKVLIWINESKIHIATWDKQSLCWGNCTDDNILYCKNSVTHWMPLPDLP